MPAKVIYRVPLNRLNAMIFPSEEWIEEYGNRVDSDAEYGDLSEGWGVDYNGDFLFVVTDMPIDDLNEDEMPDDLKRQLDEYVSEDHTGYSFIQLEDGDCPGATLVADPDSVDFGFELVGPYENWKKLIKGEINPIQGIMSGQFELNGDMQKVMQYSDAAQRLAEISSEIDSEFADEVYI